MNALNNVFDVKVGSSQVRKIFLGTNLIWNTTKPVTVPSNEIWYTSSDGNVVTPYKTNVFGANIVSNTYKNGKGVIVFDGDVTSIGKKAFIFCYSLTSVTIPDSVTSIEYDAFDYCDSLTEFTGKLASEDGRGIIIDGVFESFAPAGLTEYTIPDSVTEIGNGAFNGCSSLTSVTIGNGVTEIGDWAFNYCTSLTNVNIPDSVTEIGGGAFSTCYSLTSVTIPSSVTSIGNSAFDSCRSLTTVYCKPTIPPTADWLIFYGNASDRKIYVPIGSGDLYRNASGWNEYADQIVEYDFNS